MARPQGPTRMGSATAGDPDSQGPPRGTGKWPVRALWCGEGVGSSPAGAEPPKQELIPTTLGRFPICENGAGAG